MKDRQVGAFKQCTKCDRSYRQERSLDYHMKNKCGVDHKCTLCQLNLTGKSALRKYLLQVHNIARRKLEKYGAGTKKSVIFFHLKKKHG